MPLKLIIQNLIWDFLFFVRDITKNNSVFTLTISSGRDHPNMLPDQQDQGEEFRRIVLQLLKMINAKTKFIAIGIGVTVIFYF